MQEEDFLDDFLAVNAAEWNAPVRINPYFALHKIKANQLTMRLPERIHVVYFDAFAPERHPEMWDESVFRSLFATITPGDILTTCCAKGVIRLLLQSVGFLTERLPGPSNGKREILRTPHPHHK